ncbi:MAG: glycosyltransferase [Flavobacteriales bacterium]
MASYPRSGNTFLRNILVEVYGIESAEFWSEGALTPEQCDAFQVVKTHHLPNELPESLRRRRVVLLLRDGRDSVVSMAHHRKDIVAPGSDFIQNLDEVIEAADGSHFGGWSLHTEKWLPQADLVIRFEDLIKDPITQVERLRGLIEMPRADHEKLPGFESLKSGQAKYGPKEAGKSHLFFRRGKVNAWQDEMNSDQKLRFWHLHGEVMEIVGYKLDGSLPEPSTLYRELIESKNQSPKKLLIEASKVTEPFTDGIKRYVVEMLRQAQKWPVYDFEIHALVEGRVVSIDAALAMDGAYSAPSRSSLGWYAKKILKLLLPNGVYRYGASFYKQLQWRKNTFSSDVAPKELIRTDVLLLTLPQHFDHVSRVLTNRVVGTIHDMTHRLFPQYHEKNNIHLSEHGMQWLNEKNGALISVSNQTAQDLLLLGLESVVVSEGVDRRKFFPVLNKHIKQLVRTQYRLPKGDFLLSVSTLEPRKNLSGLIQAYSKLPIGIRQAFPLVLAGRKGWKMSHDQIPTECRSQIHFIGFVSEDHLAALYTMASAFCYVSHYEGFGLPALEAMACGCPVVVSGNSSMKEVVGEAGILVEPSSIGSIRDGLMKVCESEQSRIEWGEKSLRRSWEFTWSKCWEKNLEVWRE